MAPLKHFISGAAGLTAGLSLLFAQVPSSTNYTLKSYDLGTGGTSNSGSSNYKLNGVSGAQSGSTTASTNYNAGSGVNNTGKSNVPPAPAVTNPSSYYDRLKLIVNTGNNPSDAKFLIAVSSDGFATTQYVQTDDAIGSSQAITNYQTYAAWGSGSGFLVLGLKAGTTYQFKVKALQGQFSGSAFGPAASAATVSPTLSVSLATTATSTPPFAVAFTNLAAGTVTNGSTDALIGVTSNATGGGAVYLRDSNSGLTSPGTGTIVSATADLTAVASGYGAQVTAASQTSGGPFSKQSPYNGSANNVGAINASLQPILMTGGPLTGGSATVRLMAKVANTTPSAQDYADTLTFTTAMNF